MSDTMLLVMSIKCVRMTSLELTNGMSIWEDVGGLWPCYLLTVTLCEKFVSIPTEKRHLISAHGASFALVSEMAKSLSHVFISYNELHPGILLNKPASEIALFITPRRCCNCVPSQWMSLFFSSMMVFFLIHVHECLFLFTDRGRLLPGQAIKGKSKRWDRLITDCCCTKGWHVVSSNVYVLHSEFTITSKWDVMFFFVLILMTFRRDSPSSPPSKKAKGLGPRNTIDKFFRWWSTLIWRNWEGFLQETESISDLLLLFFWDDWSLSTEFMSQTVLPIVKPYKRNLQERCY